MKNPTFKKTQICLENIDKSIAVLQKKEKLLTKMGCVKAYIAFKTGTNKMYLRSPVDASGKRPSEYIGVDPVKQKEAKERIARYDERELVREAINTLNNEKNWLINQLKEASNLIKDLSSDATIYLKRLAS